MKRITFSRDMGEPNAQAINAQEVPAQSAGRVSPELFTQDDRRTQPDGNGSSLQSLGV